MCGIYATVSLHAIKKPNSRLRGYISDRGPDYLGEVEREIDINHGSSTLFIFLVSSVLSLRGDHVTRQPFLDDESGSALCWNGEAWKISSQSVLGNDGEAIFGLLLQANTPQAIFQVVESISGPFAFVFLCKPQNRLYFGRDRLGRRSLTYSIASGTVQFSSLGDKDDGLWTEVDADAVYDMPLEEEFMKSCAGEHHFTGSVPKFGRCGWSAEASVAQKSVLGIFNKTLPYRGLSLTTTSASVDSLQWHLIDSLKSRVLNVPIPSKSDSISDTRIAILFSGGLDCTILARLSHDLLPVSQTIDLINVAFENPRTLQAAENNPSKVCKDKEQHLADTDVSLYEACPDRRTGRKAYQELRTVCPNRKWRFVAANVSYAEALAHRGRIIELLYPHNTEMDLSIGYAFYFAARGEGVVLHEGEIIGKAYRTPARVLVSGLGADELFAGYTRHAIAFQRKGFPGLLSELEIDINRLGKRNLGRDDRIISNWGREARFPYLDELLIKWALSCPIWEKCGFGKANQCESTDMEPGKELLRLLADDLGMHSVAREKKRAIQFGARTAKMESGKTKGTSLIS